jgi:hypothetical protein
MYSHQTNKQTERQLKTGSNWSQLGKCQQKQHPAQCEPFRLTLLLLCLSHCAIRGFVSDEALQFAFCCCSTRFVFLFFILFYFVLFFVFFEQVVGANNPVKTSAYTSVGTRRSQNLTSRFMVATTRDHPHTVNERVAGSIDMWV